MGLVLRAQREEKHSSTNGRCTTAIVSQVVVGVGVSETLLKLNQKAAIAHDLESETKSSRKCRDHPETECFVKGLRPVKTPNNSWLNVLNSPKQCGSPANSKERPVSGTFQAEKNTNLFRPPSSAKSCRFLAC